MKKENIVKLSDVSWTVGKKISDVHLKFDGELVDGKVTTERVIEKLRAFFESLHLNFQ